ncbi:hydrogenase maturation nickel metallochaperone HypA [uncultured Eubacterium sp.]|uniref:hydrogenase maturation nickel metallochaperone HypA/HybF n=1 Tax=uncultured Eubacterium sp. TaxID=165185 RepID=UPI0015AA701B|nr:hydrogenase maturation nickel metallochaperone HypA [uncultured Eubacterium sp.]
MHELGIMLQIVKTIDDALSEQDYKELLSITLQVGEMTDVVPEFLKNAWESIRPNSDYPNAELIIEPVPAVAKCLDCGYTDNIKSFGFECPDCHSSRLKIISGKELIIKQLEIK